MVTTTESKKMIRLLSDDGEEYEMEESVLKEFQTIKHMIEAESVIPLANVNGKVPSKVIEYSKKHVDSSSSKSDEKTADEELKAWDAEFVKVVEAMVFDLIMKVLLDNLEFDLLKLDNKVRFILGIVKGEIIFIKRRTADLLLELHQKGFTPFPDKTKGIDAAIEGATVDADENEEESSETAKGGVKESDYEYLLSMPIGALIREKVQELCANKQKLENKLEELRSTLPKTSWVSDLDALEKQLDVWASNV